MTRSIPKASAFILAMTVFAAPALAGTLDKIKSEKKITLGYREASLPFSYLDNNQKPIGYSMDICYAIVDAIKANLKLDKLDVSLNPVTGATRIPLMANGTIDMECGSTTNNKEREAVVAFSPTTYVATSNFVAKKDKHFTDYASLKGQTVVSTSGTTDLKLINELNTDKKLDLTILPAKDHAEAFLMVETGRASAFVMDDVLLAGLVATSKDPAAYMISKQYLSLEPYGVMIRKDDAPFKAVVDKAVTDLLKTKGPALYKKWFLTSIPPRNVDLNLPMSPATEKAIANPTDSPDPAVYK